MRQWYEDKLAVEGGARALVEIAVPGADLDSLDEEGKQQILDAVEKILKASTEAWIKSHQK